MLYEVSIPRCLHPIQPFHGFPFKSLMNPCLHSHVALWYLTAHLVLRIWLDGQIISVTVGSAQGSMHFILNIIHGSNTKVYLKAKSHPLQARDRLPQSLSWLHSGLQLGGEPLYPAMQEQAARLLLPEWQVEKGPQGEGLHGSTLTAEHRTLPFPSKPSSQWHDGSWLVTTHLEFATHDL